MSYWNNKENKVLEVMGNTFVDLGKIVFAGVFLDKFLNSSNAVLGFGVEFWGGIIMGFCLLGFLIIYISTK
ncbi:MAG: hypothetical protein FWF51_09310 [Chitinivibrionia bacterium]|jgi:hypothetical protein|nr:hypothetical protein [Chitinivibrionia bacterium]